MFAVIPTHCANSFLLRAYKIRFFYSIKTQIHILVSLQVVFKGGEFSKHLFHFCSNDLRATLSDTSRLVHHCFWVDNVMQAAYNVTYQPCVLACLLWSNEPNNHLCSGMHWTLLRTYHIIHFGNQHRILINE